jgi:hypothetical protein
MRPRGELHEVDAPTGRVQLVPEQEVSRTGRGAEAAMHAGAQDFLRRLHRRITKLFGGEVGLH